MELRSKKGQLGRLHPSGPVAAQGGIQIAAVSSSRNKGERSRALAAACVFLVRKLDAPSSGLFRHIALSLSSLDHPTLHASVALPVTLLFLCLHITSAQSHLGLCQMQCHASPEAV